jgi:hypothetical protein
MKNLLDNLKYEFHSDPGHGWLKVPLQALARLDLLDRITTYSYRRNAFVYLEEDQDMGLFMLHDMKDKGYDYTSSDDQNQWFRDNVMQLGDSASEPVRSYSRFQPEGVAL